MRHPIDLPLAGVAEALRKRSISAAELAEEAIRRHEEHGDHLHAYKLFDVEGARRMAAEADRMLRDHDRPPPLCGVPVSVKDLYGVAGLPTFAGTVRRLPESWSLDAWLVNRLREQGAVLMGKTHTVELAYGAVGINPHWGTPWNPWDPDTHRIPGGSSCGAGVSLWEGSALLALGTDTGGSIRIPASMAGTVGHKVTFGRWPVDGVVPLSMTLDTVGGLTRSVTDAIDFFGALDPSWGDPAALRSAVGADRTDSLRLGVPHLERLSAGHRRCSREGHGGHGPGRMAKGGGRRDPSGRGGAPVCRRGHRRRRMPGVPGPRSAGMAGAASPLSGRAAGLRTVPLL
jgi:aspartyl-tRNA(Asn)/glutamyl-tRNA(Gln) amidotransferase subunit A